MKINSFRIYQYALELNEPVYVHGQKLNTREGLIIHLQSDQGKESFGEVAPLPGFSQETLSEALDQVQLLKTKLIGTAIPEQLTKFNGKFDLWLNPFDLKPSVRFGTESAVLHLLAAERQVPLYKLIPNTVQHKIRISGLLSGTQAQIVNQSKQLIDRGFTELKLKVGGDVEEDVQKVKALNDTTYGKVLVHLDANQMWNFDQALTFGKAIGPAAASYIEEPFKDTSRIPEFFDQTMIPVALDESLQHLSLDDVRSISGVETVVLKPTVIGGIEKILQMLTQAKDFALDTVISSSFESSLGISTLANIVEASTHNTAAGLDTLKWFKTDVLKKPIPIEHGAINIDDQSFEASDINFEVLSEI